MNKLFKTYKKQTEEELKSILSDSYRNVENILVSSNKERKATKNNYQRVISETEVGVERACLRLLDKEILSSPQKLTEALYSAKGLIINAQALKAKTNNFYSNEKLEKQINFLIKLTCEQEAAITIAKMGWKKVAEMDLKKVFSSIKKEVLAKRLAYHIILHETPEAKKKVTIFVDEAVDDFTFNDSGCAKKVGNGGYIICKGKLGNEKQITAKNTIKRATFPFGEMNRPEKIAEEVIRKALTYLAEELDFRGEVFVFSDNSSAVRLWKTNQFNRATTEYFARFEIKHITRDKNTVADRLVRENKVMPVPKSEFKAMVNKAKLAESLKTEVNELRALQNTKSKNYFGRILKMLPRSA